MSKTDTRVQSVLRVRPLQRAALHLCVGLCLGSPSQSTTNMLFPVQDIRPMQDIVLVVLAMFFKCMCSYYRAAVYWVCLCYLVVCTDCACVLVLGVLVLRHWHRADFAAKDVAQVSGADAHPPVGHHQLQRSCQSNDECLGFEENIILLICDAIINQ